MIQIKSLLLSQTFEFFLQEVVVGVRVEVQSSDICEHFLELDWQTIAELSEV
jgi:hypothetical protein